MLYVLFKPSRRIKIYGSKISIDIDEQIDHPENMLFIRFPSVSSHDSTYNKQQESIKGEKILTQNSRTVDMIPVSSLLNQRTPTW